MFALRQLKQKDAPLMLEWMHDPHIYPAFQFDAKNMTLKDVNYFIEDVPHRENERHWAIVNEQDEYLGTISIKNISDRNKTAEYAIAVRSCAHGSGASQNATAQVLQIAFGELGLNRICLNVLATNQKAIRFYRKMGFYFEGEFQQHIIKDGIPINLCWFGITKEQFYCSGTANKVMSSVNQLRWKANGNNRGQLIVIEGEKDIPFQLKRIFYIYGCDGESVRGHHANRNSEFIMICLHGSVRIRVHDGKEQSEFLLDKPEQGLYLGTMTWKKMCDFTPDAVLLVLSNAPYDAGEYIRDFDEFLKECAKHE